MGYSKNLELAGGASDTTATRMETTSVGAVVSLSLQDLGAGAERVFVMYGPGGTVAAGAGPTRGEVLAGGFEVGRVSSPMAPLVGTQDAPVAVDALWFALDSTSAGTTTSVRAIG